jgi:ketosteroid isomerase-like protein
MKKYVLIIGLLIALPGLFGCNSSTTDPDKLSGHTQTNLEENTVTVGTLKQILEAFNKHDPDAIMEFFVDDCTFDFPRGPEPWGQRFIGKAQVREAIAGRFKGIPDVHYDDEGHWVAGDKGVSKWMLTGTTTSGDIVKVRICVLWEFRKDKIVRMDTYWKIVER